ncbi:YufK family protein [Evansella sp. LMS18]|jgi:hypothetical protein|uniref:DUF5366 family protein n=1 Tax=Evansella sp. LMS18 TaxID=2924033 RepID=UPI0020D00CE6|nr:DUF5366 family protein [Evansella sp. LMS18]UTR09105.1 YufK family protein [Evansella sp. LMS18]
MQNTYLTSHFPLISLILFSLSLAVYSERLLVGYLTEIGLYSGMIEFFSEQGIHLTLLFLLWLFFFMVFSALKLIADTVNELSLLFFSQDAEGTDLKSLRGGSWIFLAGGILSVVTVFYPILFAAIFILSCFTYFVFFVYKVSNSLTTPGLAGLVFFHIFFWFSFGLAVIYALLKVYNSIIASLPI